jgi:hypothetical protein
VEHHQAGFVLGDGLTNPLRDLVLSVYMRCPVRPHHEGYVIDHSDLAPPLRPFPRLLFRDDKHVRGYHLTAQAPPFFHRLEQPSDQCGFSRARRGAEYRNEAPVKKSVPDPTALALLC